MKLAARRDAPALANMSIWVYRALIKLSGLQVRPFKVSGGFPVHLRSKHRATGLVEDSWSQTKNGYTERSQW